MGAASAAYCALSAVSKPIEEVPKVIPAWQDGAWKVRYARLVMCIRVTSLAAVVCAGGIVLLTLVLGAADASYLRSGATRPLIGNQNKTTRAVFIVQNKWGSARIRGYDAARIVGAAELSRRAMRRLRPFRPTCLCMSSTHASTPDQCKPFTYSTGSTTSSHMPHRQRKTLCHRRGLTRRSLRTKRSCVNVAIARAQGFPTTQTLTVGCTWTAR